MAKAVKGIKDQDRAWSDRIIETVDNMTDGHSIWHEYAKEWQRNHKRTAQEILKLCKGFK